MKAGLSVIGVGNSILADEGAGVHMVRHLGASWSCQPDVDFLCAETAGLGISEMMAGYDTVILLDTIVAQEEEPGAVFVIEKEVLMRPLSSPGMAGHALGLKKGLEFSRLSGTLPENLLLVAVVPAVVAYGEMLSERMALAMAGYENVIIGCMKRFGIQVQRKPKKE